MRRTTIVLTTLIIVVAALVGSGYAYIDHRFHEATFVPVKHLVPVKTTGVHANAETILLIGSTSRCALNGKQAQAFGSCSSTAAPGVVTGVTGVNSDVIMLLHADPNTHRVSILSIPRDLALYNVRPGEFHKVDAALANDPSQLVNVIEQDLGIPINHFVELNFDTFQNVVNTLGGVKVYFPDRVYDAQSGLNITTTGCHMLDGFQALALVRARHMNYWVNGVEQYDGSGDLGRIVRDHEFLRILASAVAARGLGNPIEDNNLLGAILPDLTLDSTFTLSDMVNLVLDFHAIDPAKAPQTTLPNIEDHTDYIYEGYDYGSVVLPSYPQDEQAIEAFLGTSTPPSISIATSSITVSVVDGTGDSTATSATEAKLRALGYRVVDGGNWTPVGPVAETVVDYAPGHLAQGQRVLQSLSGMASMAQAPAVAPVGNDVPASKGADVTIVTGSNFSVNGVAHATPESTHSVGGLPLSSGSSSGTLGPVSAASAPAPSYDPKACPAS